jgi:hypothetical protein
LLEGEQGLALTIVLFYHVICRILVLEKKKALKLEHELGRPRGVQFLYDGLVLVHIKT